MPVSFIPHTFMVCSDFQTFSPFFVPNDHYPERISLKVLMNINLISVSRFEINLNGCEGLSLAPMAHADLF